MNNDLTQLGRRSFLGQIGLNFGALAAYAMLGDEAAAAGLREQLPHFAPKAKRVIFLTQSGGPSQIELFDHKPDLQKLAGTELPASVRRGQRLTGMTKGKPQLVLPSIRQVQTTRGVRRTGRRVASTHRLDRGRNLLRQIDGDR